MTKRPVTIEGTLMRYRHLLSPLVLLLSLGVSLAAQEAERRPFDLTTATIDEINAAFDSGTLTSERLIELSLARIAAYDDAGPQGDPGIQTFTAVLNEANVVGGTGSTATGTASFAVVGPTLLFSIEVTGLTDVTAAHIHGPDAAGVNGGVIQGLCNSDDGSACRTGTVNGVLVAGAAPRGRISLDSLVVLLGNGMAYVNVHTTAFPGGEIRGQVAGS